MKDKLTLSGRSNSVVKPLAFALMGFGALLTAQSATAGEFGVQVLDESGAPVMGASVCVGLPGNYKQFGAMFTDEEGRAIVEVPNVPIVVTVSKTRFSGIRMSEPARSFNLIKQVTLPEGVPGPRCRAGSTLASESSIIIEKVDVLEGARATSLRPVVSGQPSHYRVSRTPDVTNSRWQSFETDIALSEGLSGEQEVYLQMRRFEGDSKSWIEARSVIVTVNLPVYQ